MAASSFASFAFFAFAASAVAVHPTAITAGEASAAGVLAESCAFAAAGGIAHRRGAVAVVSVMAGGGGLMAGVMADCGGLMAGGLGAVAPAAACAAACAAASFSSVRGVAPCGRFPGEVFAFTVGVAALDAAAGVWPSTVALSSALASATSLVFAKETSDLVIVSINTCPVSLWEYARAAAWTRA